MVLTERLRTHTLAKLTDAAAAALLMALIYPRAGLPPGVFEASAERLGDAHPRFAWAVDFIAAEISAAPGVTVCTATGLGVVWSEIHHPRIDNPSMARGRGRLIARTGASFMKGMLGELDATCSPACRAALAEAWQAEVRELKRKGVSIPRQRARSVRNELDQAVVRAKLLERELRAEFEVDDLGGEPGAADRRAVVGIMATGVTAPQLCEALRGRAAQCRRGRMWEGLDTAEHFLRIGWLCASPRRFADALASAPAEIVAGKILQTEHGTFIGGREIADGPTPTPPPVDGGTLDPIRRWIEQTE